MRSEEEITEELDMLRQMKEVNTNTYKDILLSMRIEALEWVLRVDSSS